MEGLNIQPLEEDRVVTEEESENNREQEEGEMEASSPVGSTTDEETEEDSEPEPPQVIRRKVSFADAFGLNLVSVKEFDSAEVTEVEASQSPENEATHPLEEYYMSCLFIVPSSPEELEQRLQAQMVELESIELLPGTTTLRGIIRVVNLCFTKSVYVRMSLDRWTSYFELLAEYVPGSSDRKTDRFTFKYTLVPPSESEEIRVEVCLRYECSVGTFWANNKDMNYVLFCYQKGHVKQHGPVVQEESNSYRNKRSCLKAYRRARAEEKTIETSDISPAAAEAEATHKAEEARRKDNTATQSLLYHEEHKPLVDSIKSRQRAERLARVKDFFSKRRQQVPKACSHDSANGQKVSQPLPTTWGDSASFLHKCQKKQSIESPQVLTYHQIPLLTLDWNNDKAHQWGAADMHDVWPVRAEKTLSKASEENIEDAPSVNDMWETFRNGTDNTTDKESSVRDAWQAFLNGPSCTDHSGVPESEWLQTAASVSPSNDKEPNAQYAASSEEYEMQVGTDTPTTLHAHASAVCQMLSDTCKISLANVALNSENHQPAQASVSSPRNDTATQDASQRSQSTSVTDTPQEFCLKGATAVSEGSVDSSTEFHKHVIWEQESQGTIGIAEGIGRDETFMPHTADLVTSSGESQTTDMTAMPESQNATAVDSISEGARLDEGLSSSRKGEATGTAHSVTDDTLAFRGTIRKGKKDVERFVFSTSRQGMEEGIMNECTENKVSTDEEISRPHKTEQCEISQWCADEKKHEEFRLKQNRENPLQEDESDENEIRFAQTNADESNLSQMSEENVEQSQIISSEFKLDESESEDVASNNKNLEVFKKTEAESSYGTISNNETKRLIGAKVGPVQVLKKEHNDKALQRNSSWQRRNTAIISEVPYKQSRPIQAGEEVCIQKEEDDSTLTQIQENVLNPKIGEHVLVSNMTEEGKILSWDRIIEEQQEINPAAQIQHNVESREMKKFFQVGQNTCRPFPIDKCNPNPMEAVEMRWSHSRDDMKGQKEDVGHEISPDVVIEKKNFVEKDISTELQHQPVTLERTEEGMSQRDKDEMVSIGELKIKVLGELMGNVENPQGKRRNAPAELKGRELSAEVECSPHRIEYKKMSKGTKDPITAENTAALEVIESGLKEMFIERFGEDLVRGIWEEVFGQKEQASNRDRDIVDGMEGKLADVPDITQDCLPLSEKDFNDAFDSDVFSMIELPTDQNLSLGQGLEQTVATRSKEYSPKESQSLTTAEEAHFLSESQTDLNSSVHLGQDLTPILAAQSLTESAQSSPKDQEDFTQIKERSVTLQETGRQIEDYVVAHRESLSGSAHPSHKHLSLYSDKLKESDSVVCWSVLYILSHITRLLICILLVAGFFFTVFLYDFPAFFALYIFSMCWWFYKWKRH
ncbi:uncharacterized protein ppp1r3aa [Etheostoma cragini]|uniref:uncharacterized protein ppp1r3aa n=1 Tax=Etheostoma cragini TaxID=417921 RepID=UPI00155E2768|nr:uncharacterized protein ppp1r3aa [Etheostoma cragini]XP_034718914.1 uncharacterized protein ppp1r3aa [Etheostoma cragini]